MTFLLSLFLLLLTVNAARYENEQIAISAAREIYLSNYPYQGTYHVDCLSTDNEECRTSCLSTFDDQNQGPFYKNELEAFMGRISEACTYDVLYHFKGVPVAGASRTVGRVALTIDTELIPSASDFRDIEDFEILVAFDRHKDTAVAPIAPLEEISEMKWSVGSVSSLPSQMGSCGSSPKTSLRGKPDATNVRYCSSNVYDLNLPILEEECKGGVRNIGLRDYRLTGLNNSLVNLIQDDPQGWRGKHVTAPFCIGIDDPALHLSGGATLSGQARTFWISGGEGAELSHQDRLPRELSCEKCPGVWCATNTTFPKQDPWFNPSVQPGSNNAGAFQPWSSCYTNPLMCPGEIQACDGFARMLPGYVPGSGDYSTLSPAAVFFIIILLSVIYL